MIQQLYKDTSKICDNNRNWFEELSNKNIENIYFYGFSFADIDLIYIKGVLNNINENDLKISIYIVIKVRKKMNMLSKKNLK